MRAKAEAVPNFFVLRNARLFKPSELRCPYSPPAGDQVDDVVVDVPASGLSECGAVRRPAPESGRASPVWVDHRAESEP
jgi:hypothetical protein